MTDHTTVGSIWATSWGYDQTNVEFYQVTRETKASIVLRRIGAHVEDGRLYPNPDEFMKHEKLCRKPRYSDYPSVRMTSYSHATPYEGGGMYETFAAGQEGH